MRPGTVWIKALRLETTFLWVVPAECRKRGRQWYGGNSTDTQEYEPHKQKGMDVNVDESEDEFSFVPSAVGFGELR